MADRVGALAMPATYTMVVLLDKEFRSTAALRDWLNDPAHPGVWCLSISRAYSPSETTFYFSDPNVAMEFKLRFG